jgi:hypothetical protein
LDDDQKVHPPTLVSIGIGLVLATPFGVVAALTDKIALPLITFVIGLAFIIVPAWRESDK